MQRVVALSAVAGATLLVVTACREANTVALTPAERGAIDWWLECVECREALDSLRAVGVRKPDASVDMLNGALRGGPASERVVAAERALVMAFVRDSSREQRLGLPPSALSRAAYVSENRDRFTNGYRARGAAGLGWIHTPRAVAYLDSAAAGVLPASVRSAVIYAKDSLPRP